MKKHVNHNIIYIQQDSFYVIHILKLNYHILGATVEHSLKYSGVY